MIISYMIQVKYTKNKKKIMEKEIIISQYAESSLIELKQRIDDYISKGYTKFNVYFDKGYYDEVENIRLTISKD